MDRPTSWFANARVLLAGLTWLALWPSLHPLPAGEPAPPVDPVALLRKAADLQTQKKFADAAHHWQTFIATFPSDPAVGQAYFGLGTCQAKRGKFASAMASFESALARLAPGPLRDKTQWSLARATFSLGVWKKDINALDKASTLYRDVAKNSKIADDQRASAVMYLAMIEKILGHPDQAEKFLRSLLQDPMGQSQIGPASVQLTKLLLDQHRWKEAETFGQQMQARLAKTPFDSQLTFLRAKALKQLNRRPESAKFFQQVSQNKDFPYADEAMYQWAQLASESDQFQLAANKLESLISTFPKSPYREASLLVKAQCLAKLNQPARALADVEKIKSPRLAKQATTLKISLMRTLGKYTQCLALLDKLDDPTYDLLKLELRFEMAADGPKPTGAEVSDCILTHL